MAEPKADWTAAARQHMTTALSAFGGRLNVSITHLGEDQADAHAEALSLHARGGGVDRAASRAGRRMGPAHQERRARLGFGNSFADLQASSGSDYALFTWVRDSYASGGRAAMVALAMLGVGVSGGIQIAYATLVDPAHRARGVVQPPGTRHRRPARGEAGRRETVEALLRGFPRVALP